MILTLNQRFPIDQIAPELLATLRKCPSSLLFHESYGFRHPLGSYNLSLDKIISRTNALLEILENLLINSIGDSYEMDIHNLLLEATDHFLDALMEHVEDCQGIHRSFFQDSESKIFKSSHNILKKNIEPYRKHIATIDNYLKHNQGNLRFLVFKWPGMVVPGYFVEGPHPDSGLGPAKQVHPDQNSGFSFYRDIRFHLCNVFALSNIINKRIMELNPLLSEIPEVLIPSGNYSSWRALLERIARMPTYFFPDEVKKPQPEVLIADSYSFLRFPNNPSTAKGIPSGARITSVMNGDGITQRFKMPYWIASPGPLQSNCPIKPISG